MALQERSRPSLLAIFFVVAFGISWAAWIPIAASSQGWISWDIPSTLVRLIGAFGPTLAAVIVTTFFTGRSGLRALFRRVVAWRVGVLWYAFALLWPAAQSLGTTAVHVALGGTAPDFAHPPVLDLYPAPPEAFAAGLWILLPFIFLQQLLLGSAMGEELGWRGFALPRLQAGMYALRASLVLGALWGVWHLPLFFIKGDPLADTFFGWFLLGIVGDAILYTWLFNNTGGSVLLVLLLHASTATTGLFLPVTDASPLIGAVVTWIVALTVIARFGPRDLARPGGPRPAAPAAGAHR